MIHEESPVSFEWSDGWLRLTGGQVVGWLLGCLVCWLVRFSVIDRLTHGLLG